MTLSATPSPGAPASWDPADPGSWAWDEIPALPPFQLADGSGPAVQQTRARLCWDELALHVRFDCEDRDAWGTFRQRNDPVYQEEAVEIFLSPGEEDPVRYFELEVSPLGTLFDATLHNPTSLRADMTGDPSWDCPGLRWAAGSGTVRQDWWAWLSIPWKAISPTERSAADLAGQPLPDRAPPRRRARIQRLVPDPDPSRRLSQAGPLRTAGLAGGSSSG